MLQACVEELFGMLSTQTIIQAQAAFEAQRDLDKPMPDFMDE